MLSLLQKKTIRLGRLFSQSYTSNVKFRLGLKVYSVNNIKVHSTFSSFVPSISMKTFTYVYESAEWYALNRTRKRFVSILQEKCCLDSQITEIKLEPTVITLCLYVSVCVCLHVCNVISLYVNLSFFIALFLSVSREFRNKKKRVLYYHKWRDCFNISQTQGFLILKLELKVTTC